MILHVENEKNETLFSFRPFYFHKQLGLRSEYKELELKYLKAQETIEKLQKELKSKKATQAGFSIVPRVITGSVTETLVSLSKPI